MSVVVSFAPGAEGEAAVAEAFRQSSKLQQPLTIVCTVPSVPAQERAKELSRELSEVDIVHLQEGEDAVEIILNALEQASAELLVIGLRRRTPVGKLILGSSAQRLLLDAPCPVLAVKPS